MKWQMHTAKLAIAGRVPFGNAIRRAKRQLVGYEPDPGNLRGTIEHLGQMTEQLLAAGRTFDGARVLEIGSGWFPVIPILLATRHAAQVTLTDLTPHLDETTFAATLRFLRSERILDARNDAIRSLSDLPLTYLAPFSPAAIPDGSIDVIVSRTVLEHIPPDTLVDLMAALKPKLKSQGVMLHYVDHSDHMEHVDKSISKINFLGWTDRTHRLVNWLTREGENRLRHHEYQAIFNAAGYDVVSSIGELHEDTCRKASTIRRIGRFADMSSEQVAVLASIYVCSPRS